MNSPMLYWQNILAQLWKLYGWQNGTRQQYVTLPGSTASYGECTQTCTFEYNGNLHAYLTNWPLTGVVHSGEWLSKHYKTPRQPFSKLCSNLLCTYCQKLMCRTKARLRVLSIMPLGAWAHRQSVYTYSHLSPLYLLSIPYITHVIKCTRPSPAFPYCKRRKAGQGREWGYSNSCATIPLIMYFNHLTTLEVLLSGKSG